MGRKQRKADSKGRVTLGPEWSDSNVEIVEVDDGVATIVLSDAQSDN